MGRWIDNWLARHRHPVSRVLHAVDIPMLPWAGWLAIVQLRADQWSLWYRPVGLLAISYVLQWIGHRIEGNDMGEVIVIKKLLGKPYVAVADRHRRDPTSPSARPADESS